jgi:hypothetical protein
MRVTISVSSAIGLSLIAACGPAQDPKPDFWIPAGAQVDAERLNRQSETSFTVTHYALPPTILDNWARREGASFDER